jgi:hypothetical protein
MSFAYDYNNNSFSISLRHYHDIKILESKVVMTAHQLIEVQSLCFQVRQR